MTGFKLVTKDGVEIHFKFYLDEAPVTCKAFHEDPSFHQGVLSCPCLGHGDSESTTYRALDIIQENASVFAEPGEVVVGPSRPTRR